MRLEKDDAKIGLLVFLALALFVGFLFHRSLATLLRKESKVRVRLDNAADVEAGTEVQLQGLRVGQVQALELQRDGVQYRFLATLGLRTDILLWQGTRVLVVAKPLGGAFLDLQLPPPEARRTPLDPEALLPGASGPTLASLIDQATALVGHLDQGVGELRGQLKAGGLGALLDHPRVAQALQDLDAALAGFRDLARDSRQLVAQGGASMASLDRTLAALAKCVEQVQDLLGSRRGDLDGAAVHLAGTLRELEGLARELRDLVHAAGPDGQESLKSLDRTLRATEELVELLKGKPNRVVWGKPTQAERDAAARRVEEARKAQGAKP
jgi:ABC-type transporter Mla subunit MlaD